MQQKFTACQKMARIIQYFLQVWDSVINDFDETTNTSGTLCFVSYGTAE